MAGIPAKDDPVRGGMVLTAVGEDVTVVTVGAVADGRGRFILDASAARLPAALRALCRREAAAFGSAAAEMGLSCQSLSFDVAYAVDVRGRQGDRPARPHVRTVRVTVTVTTDYPVQALADVIAETETRCPVMSLLLDMNADLQIDWVRNGQTARIRSRATTLLAPSGKISSAEVRSSAIAAILASNRGSPVGPTMWLPVSAGQAARDAQRCRQPGYGIGALIALVRQGSRQNGFRLLSQDHRPTSPSYGWTRRVRVWQARILGRLEQSMGEGFADVWALMRCWRLAAGLPSAVAFGYRAVRSLATAYEGVVTPIVARTVTDPGERARLGRALKATSLKAGAAILNYARLTGAEPRQDIAAIAGAISRLYDDLIEASPDMSGARVLAILFYAVPCTAKSGPELLLADLASEIRQRLHPLPRAVSTAFSALHDYQCSSREQREDAVPLPVVDKICRGKGAMAHLTVCSLVKPEIGVGEAELVMALGEALQSLDDYADVEQDTRDGIATLAALGATTLADIGADMRALRRRLADHYGRAASRRYCGILFYMMAPTMMGRRLPAVGRIASRLAARSAALAFLTRGPNAVPTALPLREDA